MRFVTDPRQNELFDIAESEMSPVAYNRLKGSLYAVFHYLVLEEMPAVELGEHFHDFIGRPTKELYSMCGLILLKEFHNWTTAAAVDAYLYDMRIHFALNIGSGNISFCERTLERYMALIRKNEFAAIIFNRVADKLIAELDLKVDQQRLDSTHIFSDMATFSRTKLMGVAIKRFLVQLKRHHKELYADLPQEIMCRYKKNDAALFADVSKDKEKRSTLRQDVAEQVYFLIQHFSGDNSVEAMATFKALVTVFKQQCEVVDAVAVQGEEGDGKHENSDKSEGGSTVTDETKEGRSDSREDRDADEPKSTVVVRKKTGGNIIQNPSDPDATYDGHKGVGFQAQLAETCSPDNEVQLITSVLPQTAVVSDANAIVPVLDLLKASGRMPEELLADSLYGSDNNVLSAAGEGVALVSPVCGSPPKEKPVEATAKQQRLNNRRIAQETDRWKKKYNLRAQEEGTIGCIKQRTGMVRLRYRGEESVYSSVILKVTGWNISRAAASAKIQEKINKIIPKKENQQCETALSTSLTVISVPEVILRAFKATFHAISSYEENTFTFAA